MRQDNFFNKKYCKRCNNSLDVGRTMSWFKDEVICLKCSFWEEEIIKKREESKNELEGIGHIPDVDLEIRWGEEL